MSLALSQLEERPEENSDVHRQKRAQVSHLLLCFLRGAFVTSVLVDVHHVYTKGPEVCISLPMLLIDYAKHTTGMMQPICNYANRCNVVLKAKATSFIKCQNYINRKAGLKGSLAVII